MVIFQTAQKQKYLKHKEELNKLYLDTFTKGISAQYISDKESRDYLDSIFQQGHGIFGFSENQLIAALLITPLSFDQDCPHSISNKYPDHTSEYIAEVLVDENYRGKGLGKTLMKTFEDTINKDKKHLILRVWDKNEVAVSLYKKAGFKPCGTITQKKIKPISKKVFEMRKIYMIKSY